MVDVAGAYVTIRPNLDQFRTDLKTELDAAMSGVNSNAKIGVDTAGAKASLDDISARLAQIGKSNSGASVRIGGIEESNAKLEEIRANLESIGKTNATANVSVRDNSSSSFLMQIVSWLTAMGPLAVGAGNMVGGAFIALPGILAGGAAGLGAVALGVSGIKKAITDYNTADTNTGQSYAEAQTQLKALKADMAALGPAGQSFVEWYESSFKPVLADLKSQDESNLFAQGLPGIKELLTDLEQLDTYLLTAASDIGTFVKQFADLQTANLGQLETTFANGDKFMSEMGQDVLKVVDGIENLGAQSGPILDSIAGSADNVATKFDKWTSDGGSAKFIQTLMSEVPGLKRDFDEFADTVETIWHDWEPLVPLWGAGADVLLRVADAVAKVDPGLVQMVPLVLAGYKGLQGIQALAKVDAFSGLITGLGGKAGVAGAADVADTSVRGLLGNLNSLKAIGTIGVTIAVATEINKLTSGANKTGAQNDDALSNERGIDWNPLSLIKNAVDPKQGSALPTWQYLGYPSQAAYTAAQKAGKLRTGSSILGNPDLMDNEAQYAATHPNTSATASTTSNYLSGLYDTGVPNTAANTKAANALAQLKTNAADMLNKLADEVKSTSIPALTRDRDKTNAAAVKKLQSQLEAKGLDSLANQVGDAFDQVGRRLKGQIVTQAQTKANNALGTKGANYLSLLQNDATSTNLASLNVDTSSASQAGVADFIKKLDATKKSVFITLGDQISTAMATAVANDKAQITAADVASAKTQLSTFQGDATSTNIPQLQSDLASGNNPLQSQLALIADGQQSLADELGGAWTTALANLTTQLAIQQENALDQQTVDVGNAMSTFTSDMSTIAQAIASASLDQTNDTTSKMADESAARVDSINDASAVATDKVAEQGLYGIALQAAQAKTALDEMKQSYDSQIDAQKVANDSTKATQDGLVDQASTNLANVQKSTDDAIARAQSSYDDAMAGNDSLAQATAKQVLDKAKADQQTSLALAQSQLAAAQGTAAALEAQGAQSLQTTEDQANESEATQQSILAALQASLGQVGNAVTFIINDVNNPLAAVDYAMTELHLQGVI